MEQSSLPPWLEIAGFIISAISALIGILLSVYLIQKAILENRKIRIETRKIELEVLEKENKFRKKRKSPKALADPNPSSIKKNSTIHKILADIESGEKRLTGFILKLLRPLNLEDSVNPDHQRVIGSIIEFCFFGLFIFADASFGAQNIVLLLPVKNIPGFLKNMEIPLVISSVGTSVILGIMISDLSGLTSLTFWSNLRERKKPFLAVMLITSSVNIILSFLSVLYQTNLYILFPQNTYSSIVPIASIAQNLIIAPMLVTTSFLFNGMLGALTIQAGLVYIFRILVTLLRKVIAKLVYYFLD